MSESAVVDWRQWFIMQQQSQNVCSLILAHGKYQHSPVLVDEPTLPLADFLKCCISVLLSTSVLLCWEAAFFPKKYRFLMTNTSQLFKTCMNTQLFSFLF